MKTTSALPRPAWIRGAATLAVTVAVAACAPAAERQVLTVAEHVPEHVDSILPIEEDIRRFKARLPSPATALQGGEASVGELVARFLEALEATDAAALAGLAITPAEFVYLYYPHTRYTARPYEMAPSLLWFQLENYGSRGLNRALTRYGGRSLGAVGHACPDAPEQQGPNRVWTGCVIRLLGDAGDTVHISLFGPVLERDGRFKFINFANRL